MFKSGNIFFVLSSSFVNYCTLPRCNKTRSKSTPYFGIVYVTSENTTCVKVYTKFINEICSLVKTQGVWTIL